MAGVEHREILINREKLRDALRSWETDHRAGKTRTYSETLTLDVDQVAEESASHLWSLLAK